MISGIDKATVERVADECKEMGNQAHAQAGCAKYMRTLWKAEEMLCALLSERDALQAQVEALHRERTSMIATHRDNLKRLTESRDTLAARVLELEAALKPFAKAADARRSKELKGAVCFSQIHLLKARAALNPTEGVE